MTGIGQRGLGRLRMVAAAGAIATVAAASPAAAQQRADVAPGWPQFQGNPAHTGWEPSEKSVTRANVGQLSIAWTAALPSVSDNSEVAVTGGVAYVGSGDMVTAFNATTGTQLWQATLPGEVLGTPAMQNGLVLVGIDRVVKHVTKGFVEALDSTTGAEVWARWVGALPGGDLSSTTSITAAAGRVYVTLASGRVDALGMAHGFRIWQSAVLPGLSLSQPSVADGLVVVGGGGTSVSALRVTDGTVAWQHSFASAGGGESAANWLPAISNGTAYVGLLNGVAALSLASGAVMWDNKSLAGVFFPLSVTSNAVIAGPNGGDGLLALSRSDGSVLWRSPVTSQVAGTATFGGLTWGLHQHGGAVKAVAFGRLTGHQVFSSAPFSYTDTQGFPPVVDAGRVYLNLGNELLCLALPASG
jgi:outer membrane protein assembly factor BamB